MTELIGATAPYDVLVGVLGGMSLAALLGAVASLIYLHLTPTGLSPLRSAVSQYGITAAKTGYRAQSVSFGVAGLALAWALALLLHGHGVGIVVALAAFSLGRLMISWFPMDEPGAEVTSQGRRHGLIALVTFVAILEAAWRTSGVLEKSHRWLRASSSSRALSIAMLIIILAMLTMRFIGELRRYFGAVERLYYVGFIGWLGLMGYLCVVQPR